MSKTEKRNHNEIRFLKSKIRDLEKENRQLKKLVGYQDKRKHLFENNEIEKEVDAEGSVLENKKLPCKACGKGFLEEFAILDKVFGTCNVCDERVKLK